MMKNTLLIVLMLFSFCSIAQKTDEDYNPVYYKTFNCKSSFPKIKLDGENNVTNVEKFLVKNLLNLKDARAGLKLNYVNKSPGGFHYSFTQTFSGIEVYQSEMKVNIDRKNVIRSVFDNSENTSGWNFSAANGDNNSVIALHPKTHLPVVAERRIENRFAEILEAGGEIIFQNDLRAYFAAPDSLVSGKIFNPDPLTTAQQYYGGAYVDDSDRTNASLDAQLQTVSFNANFDGSVFTLESPYVRVSDFDAPTAAPAVSDSPMFYFNRSQSGFEDVNAFYHISMMQNHIHLLGFNSADGFAEIDPHAVGGADQSYFAPGNPMRIYYGVGGVDDAEDADVCVHEYGHSVSETASPGSNNGFQRNSLDEGFGDYLAGSYSRSISTFNEYWVFNWDGHNEFWKGRILNTCRTYPDSLSATSKYRNGEMWASALFAINHDIGRDATDSLILETHYSYAMNISMADAALLLLEADTTLTNGKYYSFIYNRLQQVGFVGNSPTACQVDVPEMNNDLNIGFSQHGISFTIFNPDAEKIHLNIFNISGQLVSGIEVNQASFNYENKNLSNGIYLVQVKAKDARLTESFGQVMKTFKWCKVQ